MNRIPLLYKPIRNITYSWRQNTFPSSNINSDPQSAVNIFNRHNAWGLMVSIDARECHPDKIRSKIEIQKYIDELCALIDMKKFGLSQIVHFGADSKVAGYSMTQLIETSLISGHFANATNTAYIDIFSCKPYSPEVAAKFTADFFKSNRYVYHTLIRK
jgi:S-adenosylmethionine/arginine decarboxylase-like enzyme